MTYTPNLNPEPKQPRKRTVPAKKHPWRHGGGGPDAAAAIAACHDAATGRAKKLKHAPVKCPRCSGKETYAMGKEERRLIREALMYLGEYYYVDSKNYQLASNASVAMRDKHRACKSICAMFDEKLVEK